MSHIQNHNQRGTPKHPWLVNLESSHLDGDLVYFIEDVDSRYVDTITLHYIYEVVSSDVFSECYISVVYLTLTEYGTYHVKI